MYTSTQNFCTLNSSPFSFNYPSCIESKRGKGYAAMCLDIMYRKTYCTMQEYYEETIRVCMSPRLDILSNGFVFMSIIFVTNGQ